MNTARRFALAFTLLCAAACSQDPSRGSPPKTSGSTPAESDTKKPVKMEEKLTAKTELVVYAAASTRDALQVLEAAYEHDHPVDLVFNFGSSGDLSKQIIAAAKADVFLSADTKEMDKLEAAKLVAAGSRHDLLSNQLVVIEPADAPSLFTQPFAPAQLADAKIKHLSLGNVESVPAGKYAKAWLEKTGQWAAVSDRVLPGVDVRAARGAVESGGAEAGIVYKTDAAPSKKVRVVYAVPLAEGPKITYPVAAVAGRPNEAQARAFVTFLESQDAQAAFEGQGFLILPPPSR